MYIKDATYLNNQMQFCQGGIVVEDGRISITDPNFIPSGHDVFDAGGYIVLPGLMNSHFHSYSPLAKGLVNEVPIQEWLDESERGRLIAIFFENPDNIITEEDFLSIALYSYVEMIKQGITFVSEADPSDSPKSFADTVGRLGMRGVIDAYADYPDYYERRVGNFSFATHLLEEEDINDETLQQCVQMKTNFDPLMMTHCMENQWRHDLIHQAYDKSSVELYEEKGLLDNKTVLYHGVHLSDRDIDLIANSGASVVHCPVSNLWSGAGAANISGMLQAGVNVCIGTDFGSTDIWEDMRTAYLLLKLNAGVGQFSAEDIFKMATVNGAKAYQLEGEIGTIADGFKADLIFVKKDPGLHPLINTGTFSTYAHNLLMHGKDSLVHHVMVDGNWVMKDRVIQTIDEEKVRSDYMRVARKLFNVED
ncbi:amidohydrolase family protein [Bacillus sp. EB01]|uniref:amidohydrolase family protein n=1 Tax=Bacillus sp. EB01 TaxID=1347086 RepID=UPI0005C44908|nr:amidohydrolase family protein [Bacillus sp. EB01]